jgi:hypothetical protein
MSTVLYQRTTRPDRIAGRPHFSLGQRVVCVDASANARFPEIKPPLIRGKIYLVRAVVKDGNWKPNPPGWGLLLKEAQHYYPGTDNKLAWPFHPRRFIHVINRPTSIKVLEELLTIPADIERQLRDEMGCHTVTTMRALATDFAPQMELFQEFRPIPKRHKRSRRKPG